MKHLLFLLLFLNEVTLDAEDLRIISSGGYQGIADEKGTVVIPPVYESLGWSDGDTKIVRETIGYLENGRWGLINIREKKITSARYAVLHPFGDRYFEAGITYKFSNLIFRGLLDEKARVVIDLNYFSIQQLAERRLLVSRYEDRRIRYGMLSEANETILDVSWHAIKKEGELLVASNGIGKKRVFDLNGRPVLDEWVDNITMTSEGYQVENEGRMGLIDHSGLVLHLPRYKRIENGVAMPFHEWMIQPVTGGRQQKIGCDSVTWHSDQEILIAHINDATHILGASDALFKNQQHRLRHAGGGFLVTQNVALGTWGIYKTDGQEVASGFDSVSVDSTYFFTQTGKSWDVYNLFGRKINERPYQMVGISDHRNIPVRKNDYWGWVDFQGNQLIEFKFDAIQVLGDGDHFIANYLDSWGVSSFSGSWAVLPEYDSVFVFDDLYVAKKGWATHVFRHDGNLLSRIPYALLADEMLRLQEDSLYGLVTSTGRMVEPQYDHVSHIDSFYKLRRGDELSLIDPEERLIVKPGDRIQDVLDYSEGYFLIRKDGKYGFVDTNGKLRISNRYDEAMPYREGLARVSLLGRWGYVDKQENLVIQPYYKHSSDFKNGLAIVATGENYGLIDKKGQEVIEMKWKDIARLATGNYLITDWDDKVGMANEEGTFILRPNFDHLEDTQQSLIITTQGGKQGVLDYSGYAKVPIIYDKVQIQGEYLLLLKNE